MKHCGQIALAALVVFGFGLRAGAAGDSSWLKGARVVINGGPCHGTFTLDLNQGPEMNTPGNRVEMKLSLSGRACATPPDLVVTTQDSHLFAVSVEYHADAPVAPVAGFVLYLKAPAVSKVHASYVPSKMNDMWVEPFFTNSLAKLPPATEYVLWQGPKGGFGAAIPLVGGGHRSLIQSEAGEIKVVASDFDSHYVPKRVPLLAWGQGKDPYRLNDELFAFAMEVMGARGKLRREKAWPEIFNYLGWCSWNTYYRNINEEKLAAHARHFQEAGLPFRWILIDDGWQTLDKRCSGFRPCVMHLTSFEAVPDRFPGGLKQTTEKIKSYGITWVGVWHTLEGYWNGVAINSELGRKYADALLPYSDKGAVPDPRSEKGERFYDDFYAFLKGAGVDFVKVDNQSGLRPAIKEKINIADGMAGGIRNLETAAARYFNSAVIDCMSQNLELLFTWALTNDSRNSIDYVPILPNNPRAHIFKNAYNALWYSEVTTPDWDMWKSHDQAAVMHAVGRAISGGPVYVTDDLGRERKELLLPLVFSNGRVLPVDDPGLPTRDVLFTDPRFARVPLKVFARAGKSGLVAAWNVNYLNLPVRGAVSPSDCEGLRGERFAVYEHFSGKLDALGPAAKQKISLWPFGVKLYVIVPIEDGFAAIGLSDKFISPAAIIRESRVPGKVELELVEGGRFAAYAEKAPKEITVNGEELAGDKISYQGQKLILDLTGMNQGPIQLALSW